MKIERVTSFFSGTYPVFSNNFHTFLFGNLHIFWNEFTHHYRERTSSLPILRGYRHIIAPQRYQTVHSGSIPRCLQIYGTEMYAVDFGDVLHAKKKGM